jgi:ADP-heptose:LPS heptosyltransferase
MSFISLQKGPAAEQLKDPPPGMNVRNYADELRDFSETAAALENLDLLIVVDTSVAHLSGALGRPTWLLLPIGPDWRWMEGREDTPWYPTMRLFRQTRWRDWTDVVERVADELVENAMTKDLV